MAIIGALVKLVSLSKDLATAWTFGTGDDLDAFLMAYLLPSFIINVVAGSLNAALIPTYIQVREREGLTSAQKLFSGAMLWSLLLLAAATLLLMLIAPFFIPKLAMGFSPEKIDLTCRLLYIVAPVIVVSGLISTWTAVLNAGERFALGALTPAITPLITVIMILACGRIWGVLSLALGIVLGMSLEAAVLGWALKRQGFRLLPAWRGFDPHVRQVASQFGPMIAASLLMSGTFLIDQAMAATLDPGSVSTLNYASKLTATLLALTSGSLSAAVIPYFSKMVASSNWTGIKDTLYRYLTAVFVVSLPITLTFYFFSEEIIRILFQQGKFTPDDVQRVAFTQALYSLQLPFYVAGVLVVRLISAMRASHVIFIGNGISLALNICLNLLFMHQMGVAGLALSTSCVYFASFLYLFGCYHYLIGIKVKHGN